MRTIHRVPRPGSARDRHRDVLAQRHVMGLLGPAAERAFRAWMSQDARLQAEVRACEHTLAQLSMCVPPMAPSAQVWRRLQSALPREPRRVADRSEPWWRRLFHSATLQLAGAACAGALSFAVLSPVIAPKPGEDEVPASYVGVLADAGDRAALVVASRRRGRVLQIKLLQPLTPPAGREPVLWLLTPGEAPRAAAWLPRQGKASLSIPAPAETTFARVTRLAVSLEPKPPADATALPAAPTASFVWSGHCAKVW